MEKSQGVAGIVVCTLRCKGLRVYTERETYSVQWRETGVVIETRTRYASRVGGERGCMEWQAYACVLGRRGGRGVQKQADATACVCHKAGRMDNKHV